MNKIFFILAGIFILCSVFVQAAQVVLFSPFEGNPVNKGVNSVNFVVKEMVSIDPCENGCFMFHKCWNVTTILQIGGDLIHCDKSQNKINYQSGSDFVIYPKMINQSCTNDTQCQSKECSYGECAQKREIKINTLYSDESIIIQNLVFPEKEIFYFQIFDKIYSILFLQNNSDFLFWINGTLYNVGANKNFVISNNSQFILNSIYFEDSIAKANVTFIESKTPFNNSKELINSLLGNKENKTIESKENISLIIENVVGNKKENFFSKMLNWFKNLFSKR